MTGQAIVYLVLMVVQFVGAVSFVTVYRHSDWRATAVGRHLMFFAAAAGAVDASWLLLLLVQWPWLTWVLFAAQGTVAALIWQRVGLVWRAQRADSEVT